MNLMLALAINIILLSLTFLYVSQFALAIMITLSLLVWFFYYLWQRQNTALSNLQEKLEGQALLMPPERVLLRAIESSGYSQTSGMGYLALTDNGLYFELILFDLSIQVPTALLKDAEMVNRLKGVAPGRKMLRILYSNQYGERDSIAIHTKDMASWKRAILAQCENSSARSVTINS